MDEREQSRKAGRRILFGLLAAFSVVAAADGFFIYKAVATHSGSVVDNPYQRGLEYNRTLAAAAQEETLGWETALEVIKVSPGVYDLSLRVTGKDGKPVALDNVRGKILRPAKAGDDVAAEFRRGAGGLAYTARLPLPYPGQWEVDAVLEAGAESVQFVKRIVVE